MDKNTQRLILSTDLSLAHDTMDSQTLQDKIKYYGIEGRELDLFNHVYQKEPNQWKYKTKGANKGLTLHKL